MASTPQFVGTAKRAAVKLDNAAGTTLTTLLTVASGGGAIEALLLTSTDTTSRLITLFLGDGTTDFILDRFTIPAATSGTPVQVVNLMDPARWSWLDPANVRMLLAGSSVLKVQMATAVSATFETSVIALYGEF